MSNIEMYFLIAGFLTFFVLVAYSFYRAGYSQRQLDELDEEFQREEKAREGGCKNPGVA